MARTFLADETGATAIEHALLAAFIALALIAAVSMTGRKLFSLFAQLTQQVGPAESGSSSQL